MGESQSRTKIAWLLLFLALFTLLPAGCRHKKGFSQNQTSGLPRPSPAYIQFLRQQSMLSVTDGLIAQVSGTDRMWRFSGTEERYALLLREAPTWIAVMPRKERTEQAPVFVSLARKELIQCLCENGIQGIYVAPTGETDAAWTRTPLPDPLGDRVASLSFAAYAGNDESFARFLDAASSANLQIGGSLPPAATGMGPDFMLATRGLPSFEGLYALISLPRETWPLLPSAESGDVAMLSSAARADLVNRGFLPQNIHKDRLPWANASGWAVTAEITGEDGNVRRFAYCFDGDIYRPVLFWQDPSGYAKRLYAAAVIRHTGLQQQTLAALPLKALMGLDAYRQGEQSAFGAADLEPGLSAFAEVSQTVRRYGGWSMTSEDFPPEILSKLATRVDFLHDSAMKKAFATAEKTGDAGSLALVLKNYEAQGLSQRRLVHDIPAGSDADALFRMALPVALPGLCFLDPAHVLPGRAPGLSANDGKTVQNLLKLRKKLGTAEGSIRFRTEGKHALVVENTLPNGDTWVAAINFSRSETVRLPLQKAGEVLDIATKNRPEEMTNAGGQRILVLKPRAARHILVGHKAFSHF